MKGPAAGAEQGAAIIDTYMVHPVLQESIIVYMKDKLQSYILSREKFAYLLVVYSRRPLSRTGRRRVTFP